MGESTRMVSKCGSRFPVRSQLSNTLVFNIPARHLEAYRGRDLIVRSATPREVIDNLSPSDLTRVRFLQLLSMPEDTSDLEAWGEGIPIDLVMKDPVAEFAQLYNYTNLLDTHPVRVSIPVVPGFSKAAKLAVSLSFAVQLQMEQPDSVLIEELTELLDLYLHRGSVNQPIEFFHTVLLSFYQEQPASLWEIAEEDPAQVRYVTDDGEETISPRFADAVFGAGLDDFVERYGRELISEKRECHDCEFFSRCGGYFKWPEKLYDCKGVKTLFMKLRSAADEVKTDLATFSAVGGGPPP